MFWLVEIDSISKRILSLIFDNWFSWRFFVWSGWLVLFFRVAGCESLGFYCYWEQWLVKEIKAIMISTQSWD